MLNKIAIGMMFVILAAGVFGAGFILGEKKGTRDTIQTILDMVQKDIKTSL